MRKLFFLIFVSSFLFSCQKDHQISIVGRWQEVAVYSWDHAGQLNWGPASKFPIRLSLNADGKFSAYNDMPAGNGMYQFNNSTNELKFERSNPVSTDTHPVSQLDDNYLIIDYADYYKVKFTRID